MPLMALATVSVRHAGPLTVIALALTAPAAPRLSVPPETLVGPL